MLKTILALSLFISSTSLFAAKDMVTFDYVSRPLTPQQRDQIEKWITKKKVDTIVSGTIDLHPNIKLPPGGDLHLRLVNLSSLFRPFIFKRYHNVHFPFKYEILTSDFVGGIGPLVLFEPYFLEAFYFRYRPDKTPADYDADQVAGGEAWGNPGRPYPLAFGQTRDFKLNFWWTREMFGSKFSEPTKNSPNVMSGWLYLSTFLKEKLGEVQSVEGNVYVCDQNLKQVKSVPFKLADLDTPFEWHADLPSTTIGYITVMGTAKKKNGETIYIRGGRASPKVIIKLPVASLKIVLTTISEKSAEACVPRKN